MIRMLIIDDQSVAPIIANVGSGVGTDSAFEPVHINPLNFFGKTPPEDDLQKLLAHIKKVSELFWDVIAIDLYLGETGLSKSTDQLLPLLIAEKFREQNHSATLLLYSGTLSTFIEGQIKNGGSDTFLRRIFQSEIFNFMPRNRIDREILSAIDNPSWPLRIDRMLMNHATMVVTPEEAEFCGKTFLDLAQAVRRQDAVGEKIAQQIAEYGIASFVELNS